MKKYHESALIEAQILRDVNDREREERRGRDEASLCVEMFGHFEHQGHCCLVFECLGLSLYEYLKKNEYRGFPMDILRPISRELLQVCAVLFACLLMKYTCDVRSCLWKCCVLLGHIWSITILSNRSFV